MDSNSNPPGQSFQFFPASTSSFMKHLTLLTGLLFTGATLSAQVLPDTFQRITSTAAPGASYDFGVAGSDGSFSIDKTGAPSLRRLTIDSNGNVTVLNNLTVSGSFSATNFAGGALTGGATGLVLNAGGTDQSITFTPSGTGAVVATSSIRAGGSVTSPSFSFTGDNDSGLYSVADGQIGLSANGVRALTIERTAGVSVLTGNGGLTVNASGPLNLNAGGTNQNVTISPSGTGSTILQGNIGIGLGAIPPSAPLDVITDVRVRRDLYVDGVIHVASGNVQAATTTDAINITSTTDSSGYGTGALIVSGGAGIAKNLSVGQNITAAGAISANGSISAGGNLSANGNITTSAGTVSAAVIKVGNYDVWHKGEFDPASFVRQNGGVVNGGASGLTINAGAANQSLVLDSDGTGRVEVRDTLAVTNTTGSQYLLLGNQDVTGANNPAILRATNGGLEFGRGNSWIGQGGTFTSNVTFANNGNVGIGVATPNAKLTVAGALSIGVGNNLGAATTGDLVIPYGQAIYSTNGVNNSAIRLLSFGNYGGDDHALAVGNTGVNSAWPKSLQFYVSGPYPAAAVERMRIASTGNLLLGTATDSGNGRLQLATHTTSAGGIGFGTDTALYRRSANSLSIAGLSTVNLMLDASGVRSWEFQAGSNLGLYPGSTGGNFVFGGNIGTVNVASPTASSSPTTGALVVNGGVGIGGNANVTGQTTTGNLLTNTTAYVGTHLTVGGNAIIDGTTRLNSNLFVPTANVGLGVVAPFTKLQVAGGGVAVTGPSGGFVHLADDLRPDGSFGVRLAGIDNPGNGHDLVVQTRTTAGGAFQPAFTVKSTGAVQVAGSLKLQSPTGAWWGMVNSGGTMSLFRENTPGGVQTAVATFNPDNSVAFTGRISVAAPTQATDAATKLYVDESAPWDWGAGDVTLKNVTDKLGVGTSQPAVPLHVQSSDAFGEIARFATCLPGQLNYNINERSFISLLSQNPSNWWELSVQGEEGHGSHAGFALRSKDSDESVSKPRLYFNEGSKVQDNVRSYMRLYGQNPAYGWEFSVEDPVGQAAVNGLAIREYAQANTGNVAFYIADGGHIGIGTTTPGTYALAVNGSIHTREVVVDLTGWPDYVFAAGYKPMPLAEVETHIKQEGHLPGVPSAREVSEKGVGLGAMQATLLAKVEELTLHLIAQEKEIAALRQQVGELKAASANP